MEDLALDDAGATDAQAFEDRVANLLFAVFAADTAFQEHARSLPSARQQRQGGRSAHGRHGRCGSCHSTGCDGMNPKASKTCESRARLQ